MAQILDLSKKYSQKEIEQAVNRESQYDSIEAGGYVCKIVDAVLNKDKQYIELSLDIADGKYEGYFQKLEDRAGFWGLKSYMSFKETIIGKFAKTCTSINNSNPDFNFNPFKDGGSDIDSLIGKKIGAVIGLEEYKSASGEIRLKCNVANVAEVSKILSGKFRVPELKKLDISKEGEPVIDFMKFESNSSVSVPF